METVYFLQTSEKKTKITTSNTLVVYAGLIIDTESIT